jgi:hypothetical protein
VETQSEKSNADERKPYAKPVVLHEFGLEAHGCVGSGIDGKGIVDPLDNQAQ